MILPGILNFFKTISFLILSWLLVHFFAIFGVFVFVSYPIWWFFLPQKTLCLFCHVRKVGSFCPLCRQVKMSSEENYPKNFRSVFVNALFILLFSLLSFGLVFVEAKILFNFGFPPTAKTVSFVIPSRGQFMLGEIFPMKVDIAGIKKPVNAVQADIGFDASRLEIVEISSEESFANIFIQKEINNDVGYARLTGGLPNPGFFADHGVFGVVYFRSKASGLTQVEFLPSSLVLANDGRGTNVLKDLAKAAYLILPERISQVDEEAQEAAIRPLVLGEKSEDDERMILTFYEEDKVLGAEIDKKSEEKDKISFWEKIFDFLKDLDSFILNFWPSLFLNLYKK